MDRKGTSLPESDSGYFSTSPKKDRVILEAVSKREMRRFKAFVGDLNDIEFSSSDKKREEQIQLLDRYFRDSIAKEEKEVKEELFFKILDLSIAGKFFIDTLLPDNEGSAFLEIARSCSNIAVIKKVIEIISIEKSKSEKHLVEKYADRRGHNILHILMDRIVKLFENGFSPNWEAFDYFSELAPDLLKAKDFIKRTPEDILTQQTELTLENRDFYILEPASSHGFFKS